MKTKNLVFCLLALCFVATGCDRRIATPDGKVPEEFRSIGKQVAGVYTGTFEKSKSMKVSLNMAEDGTATLATDGDLLRGCKMTIKALTSIDVYKNKSERWNVALNFRLDKGNCAARMAGDHLIASMDSRYAKSLSLRIMQSWERVPGACTYDPYFGLSCAPDNFYYNYFRGQFTRD